MHLKTRDWNRCPTCNNATTLKNEDIFGCDLCRREIDMNKKHTAYLEATVFSHKGEPKHIHLCGWKCFFRWAKKARTDYFISLPMVTFDDTSPLCSPSAFRRGLR